MNGQKKRQLGVSLSGLLIGAVIFGLLATLGMKTAPAVIDYFKIVQAIKAVSKDSASKGGTVADIRLSLARRFSVDNIDSLQPADIDVSKEGNDIVLSFAYAKRIPLVGNVSLVIDFEGSSAPGK